MIDDPSMFTKKAREWAVRYAGAGEEESSLSEEDKKRRELDGFNEMLVMNFTGMGFEVRAVVGALRGAGVKRDASWLAEEQAGRVVERLIGAL
jgi:ubiquitin-conjugating enzyme (huntingtin interacting protein 2)